MSMETIGPTQVVGPRLWFGKDFYSGEGYVGVGGFGYFDTTSRSFRIFSVREVEKASVFAIYVEGSIVWLGLGYRGEWGDAGKSLLRVDMRTMRCLVAIGRKFPLLTDYKSRPTLIADL